MLIRSSGTGFATVCIVVGLEEWELYHLDEDFSEAKDLAAAEPEKLAELDRLF